MITQINDFIFCPRSIYYHDIYRNTTQSDFYHQSPQRIGQAAHATIDTATYSTRKGVITGITVYSASYNLLGRIDILDTETGLLTERKYAISALYDGFRYQLYAQYFALTEMGYTVLALRLHSVKDNRLYPLPLPTTEETLEFEALLTQIRQYHIDQPFSPNPRKCLHCIYATLCDLAPTER